MWKQDKRHDRIQLHGCLHLRDGGQAWIGGRTVRWIIRWRQNKRHQSERIVTIGSTEEYQDHYSFSVGILAVR